MRKWTVKRAHAYFLSVVEPMKSTIRSAKILADLIVQCMWLILYFISQMSLVSSSSLKLWYFLAFLTSSTWACTASL